MANAWVPPHHLFAQTLKVNLSWQALFELTGGQFLSEACPISIQRMLELEGILRNGVQYLHFIKTREPR